MIVVDSSAIMSVLLKEPDALRFARILEQMAELAMSAGTLVEAGAVVLRKRGDVTIPELFQLLELAQVEIVPVSEQHARTAIDAYARFGRGTGHPAGLNFGDCFAYALAKTADAPLLYKGGDFAMTDIRSAL